MGTLIAFVATWIVLGWFFGWSTHSRTIDGDK